MSVGNITGSTFVEPVKIELSKKQKIQIKFIRKISRFIDYIILILSLFALCIGAYAFWDTHQVFEIASSEEYAVYKPNSKENLSFDELKKLNKDVFAWIDVYGTKIDYPIVQGEDNSEYLNKTVLGEFSTAGSIFLDHRNSKDLKDFQDILYGHYMAERKMFGDMELFKDESFFDTHKYGVIHREGTNSLGIEFFAFMKTVGTDSAILSPAKMKAEKPELIKHIYEEATFSRDLDFSTDDNILILDTCDLSVTNGRYILVGRLTDKVEENIFKEKVVENKFSKLVLSKTYKLDILRILGIAWIVIFIIYVIYEISRAVYKKIKDKKSEENKEKE